PFVRVVEVAHDVQERAAALFGLADADFELGDPGPQLLRLVDPGVGERAGVGTHGSDVSASRPPELRSCSSSFSSAIIFSSRPTTTSSTWSKSRICSWGSAFGRSGSRTAFS